ncbi:MAG: anaerobic ribonucleoside-triphosphate reductase activating protein [Spirochaetes bacterium GWC1_27_15]|nr:MAG: anaerobic ribonucleoside-triphosphate reductase activating protein [Spirochaetes bacterium GWC1_27_15]
MIEIAGIRKESLEDGKGIRTVIYFQGCKHKCSNCQNPHTWEWGEGQLVSMQYLLNIVKNDTLSKGVTFSGGCPMCNAKSLIPLAKKLKELGYSIWAYCGETIEDLNGDQLDLLQYIDVLIDGRYEDKLRDDTLAFRGSSNQRIINVKESIRQNKVIGLLMG